MKSSVMDDRGVDSRFCNVTGRAGGITSEELKVLATYHGCPDSPYHAHYVSLEHPTLKDTLVATKFISSVGLIKF